MENLIAAVASYVTWISSNSNALFVVAATAAFVAAETLLRSSDQPSWRGRIGNMFYVLTLLAVYVFLYPLIALVTNQAAALVGGPYLNLTTDAAGSVLPMIAGLLVYAAVFDFFYYWHHRLQHRSATLWLTHKLHHVDESLNVTTTFKHHWLDDVARVFTMYVPMGILFKFEPITIWWLNYVLTLHGMLVHMNIDLQWGRLTLLLTSPSYHRIHHSVRPEHIDRNFAFYFPVLDYAFGTYVKPIPGDRPQTGLSSGEKISGLFESHAYPFRAAVNAVRKWKSADSRKGNA